MNERKMQLALRPWLEPQVTVPNFTGMTTEADLVAIQRKSTLVTEYEIKVSRADLLKEFRGMKEAEAGFIKTSKGRKHWHLIRARTAEPIRWQPNYFCFAVVPDLVEKALESPEWVGVVSVDDRGRVKRHRAAKKIHGTKPTNQNIIKLTAAAAFRSWRLLERES